MSKKTMNANIRGWSMDIGLLALLILSVTMFSQANAHSVDVENDHPPTHQLEITQHEEAEGKDIPSVDADTSSSTGAGSGIPAVADKRLCTLSVHPEDQVVNTRQDNTVVVDYALCVEFFKAYLIYEQVKSQHF